MISTELLGILGFLVVFALLALGMHIGTALGIIGYAGCVVLLGFTKSFSIMATTPFVTVANFSFVVLPMFILMGEFAFQGGMGVLLYNAASKWLGRLHGGLAMATVGANALFGAVSGSTAAAAASFGKLAVPEMMRYNYDRKLAGGVVAASGTLSSLIPPSGVMVLYCIFTEESLGKLMIAGFIPGFLSALIYMVMIYVRVRLNPQLGPRSTEIVPWKERLLATRWLTPIAVVMIVMLGGIYMGVFSAIEAGAAGAFIVLVVVLVRRSLSLKALRTSLTNTARTSTMLFWVLIGAMIFAKFIVLSGLPDLLLAFVTGLAVPPIGILIVVLLVYVVLGCIMDVPTMLAITLTMFYPLLISLGFDGIWLGILTIKIVEIAVITPPIGINVFVLKGVVGDVVGLGDLFRGISPFFVMDIITLAILVAFPQICLWLPSTMLQ
jgi:C4-dicarboxylate transporter DctM subunit